jgi:hypothetical protein
MSCSTATVTAFSKGIFLDDANYPNSKKESMTRTDINIDKNGHGILIT